jgi:hypothetical protein
MKRIPLSSAVAIFAFCVSAAPGGLAAQGARQRGTASTEGRAVSRPEARRDAREVAPPPPAAQAQPQQVAQPSRGEATERVPPPRRLEPPPAIGTAVSRQTPRVVMPQVVVPQVIQPRVETITPGDHPSYRADYRPNYRVYQPDYRPQYQPNYRTLDRRPRSSYRPYYTFLPRVRLAAAVWIGYPVNYPTYFYPSSYPYTYVYPDTSAYQNYAAATAAGAAGGLSFEITPPDAGVYVDGVYVGAVEQFTPDQPPLSLAPGRHHVEIREPGFEIVAFDVDVLPGQVIPYRGDLQRF